MILENLVDISKDLQKLEVGQLLRILEIADFLQMESLTKVFEELISNQISKENIYDIVNVTEKFQCPNINTKCCNFVKENITQLDLKLFSRPWLKTLMSSPVTYSKDKFGRLLSFNESETLVVSCLEDLDPTEDWNIPLLTIRRDDIILIWV